MDDMISGARPSNMNANRNVRKDGAILHCEWYNSTRRDASGRLLSVLSLILDVTDRVGRQVLHLSRIVDDLLDVTRIARGKIHLHPMEVDLGPLVRRVVDDHRGLFAERELDLVAIVPQNRIPVSGDETRLAQVLGNLLQNAARFTPPGGKVVVALELRNGSVELHVRDTGIGIEQPLLSTIFEPFTQVEQSLARTTAGLGLGLALVKGLVELHGGQVSAFSEGAGRGTDVSVRLPLVEPATREQAPRERGEPHPSRRRRVLVVDDNRDAAESMAQLLELLGHDVRVAYDGEAGVAMARAHPPDLILCDIGLPGMDGYAVAREVRHGGPAGVRLVAVSGYARPEDVERATQAGFEAHLAKPPDPDAIQVMLE